MSRVAIHLADPAPVDRDLIRSLFRDLVRDGSRIVNMTHSADGDPRGLSVALKGLGGHYEKLLLVTDERTYLMAAQGGRRDLTPGDAGDVH